MSHPTLLGFLFTQLQSIPYCTVSKKLGRDLSAEVRSSRIDVVRRVTKLRSARTVSSSSSRGRDACSRLHPTASESSSVRRSGSPLPKPFESIIDQCTVPSLALRTDLFLPFLSLESSLSDLLSSILSILFTSTIRLRMPSDCFARLTRWWRCEGAIRLEDEPGPVIDEKEALPLYWHSPGVGEEEEEYTRT